MTIEIPPCGPHCGIASAREGHCDCELCHDGTAPVVITRSDLLTVIPKSSMCNQWYERAGDYRPWDHRVGGCMCGVSAHALPEQHGEHCPVRQYHDRTAQASAAPQVSDGYRDVWGADFGRVGGR
jgi:hypothetical protein